MFVQHESLVDPIIVGRFKIDDITLIGIIDYYLNESAPINPQLILTIKMWIRHRNKLPPLHVVASIANAFVEKIQKFTFMVLSMSNN